MAELFTHYSVSEIILFTIVLAIAIKGVVDFFDWLKKRTRQAVKEADRPIEIKTMVMKHKEELDKIKEQLDSLNKLINLLIESDKDDIKYSITKDHHYYCYKVGSIDDYTLDCIEKRYSHYTDEGGNSFVKELMQDLRALPRKMGTKNN